jgi:hypothetical protein
MTTTEVTTTIRNLKELMNMKEELEAEITAAQDVKQHRKMTRVSIEK